MAVDVSGVCASGNDDNALVAILISLFSMFTATAVALSAYVITQVSDTSPAPRLAQPRPQSAASVASVDSNFGARAAVEWVRPLISLEK